MTVKIAIPETWIPETWIPEPILGGEKS